MHQICFKLSTISFYSNFFKSAAFLMRLMRSIGLGRFHLRMLLLQWWEKPIAFVLYPVSDLRKILVHLIRVLRGYRHITAHSENQLCDRHTVAACEMERLIGTFLSPFYLTKIKVQNLKFKF